MAAVRICHRRGSKPSIRATLQSPSPYRFGFLPCGCGLWVGEGNQAVTIVDIPVCILVLKKCKKPDDVLFINAAEHFVKGKRQNQLTEEHIAKIIATYQFRKQEPRYARRVEMEEIEKNDFNLNISRYISTAVGDAEIDLKATHGELAKVEKVIAKAKQKHNAFLQELGLKPLP
jgi:type I restriction enzyme M protein